MRFTVALQRACRGLRVVTTSGPYCIDGEDIIPRILARLLDCDPVVNLDGASDPPESLNGRDKLFQRLLNELVIFCQRTMSFNPREERAICRQVVEACLTYQRCISPHALRYVRHRLVVIGEGQMTDEEATGFVLAILNEPRWRNAHWGAHWNRDIPIEHRTLVNVDICDEEERSQRQLADVQQLSQVASLRKKHRRRY